MQDLLQAHYQILLMIFHRAKYKYRQGDKKCETCRIKYKCRSFFLEYKNPKDELMEWKCSCCSKNYQQKVDEKLKDRFFNTYKLSNHHNNKFNLLLRKGVDKVGSLGKSQ